MSGKAVGGRLKHRAMSISFSEERRDHLAFVNEDTDPTGRLGHLHRRPHCTARFRAITLEYRDFGQQQFKRDRRSNGATALHEFEPALGNFPGADQSVSLHFYPQPCNGARSEERRVGTEWVDQWLSPRA